MAVRLADRRAERLSPVVVVMRRFVLVRDTDVTGVSGEGVVVWGLRYPDGRVSYRWNSSIATTVAAESVEDVIAIHGHDGATRLVWVDEDPEEWRDRIAG